MYWVKYVVRQGSYWIPNTFLETTAAACQRGRRIFFGISSVIRSSATFDRFYDYTWGTDVKEVRPPSDTKTSTPVSCTLQVTCRRYCVVSSEEAHLKRVICEEQDDNYDLITAQEGNPVSSQPFGQSFPSLKCTKTDTIVCQNCIISHWWIVMTPHASVQFIQNTHMLLDKPAVKVFSSLGYHIRRHGITSPHGIVQRVSSYQSLRDTSSSLSRFPPSRTHAWEWDLECGVDIVVCEWWRIQKHCRHFNSYHTHSECLCDSKRELWQRRSCRTPKLWPGTGWVIIVYCQPY